MHLTPTQVESYAGHKADETPRRFFWEGEWLEVVDVADRWHEGGGKPEWPLADYFKVLTEDGGEYLLKHDREVDQWFTVRRR